ncbi:MAG: ACT domain-containing protein, partial [Myxococcota bacterium]
GDPSLSIRHASLAQKKADALRCMADGTSATAAPGVGAVIAAMVSNMPGRYTRGQDAYSIHRHAEVVAQHLHRGAWATVAIVPPRGARPEGLAGPTQICLVAADSHGLLAQITAALAQCRLHVHAAQIHSFAIDEGGEGRRLALDLFWVERAGGDEVRPLLPKLERTLASLLEGEAEGPDIVPRAPRSLRAGPEVPTRVIVDTRVAPHHTVVEVFSLDRPGVLFRIAHALFHQGMTIELAKISTEGSRVVDVFYVTDQRGAKVTDRGSVRKLRQAIVASLAEEQPEA